MTTQVNALLLPTPAGELAILTSADGTVLAAGFAGLDQMTARLHVALRSTDIDLRHPAHQDDEVRVVTEAVSYYADGDLTALDRVPVSQPGGPFTQRAWTAMRGIGPGETLTYSELAQAAGNPAAVRAAGSACARNLIAPFVPCHRVVRTDGTLGGYYYGLDVKRALLTHEARD